MCVWSICEEMKGRKRDKSTFKHTYKKPHKHVCGNVLHIGTIFPDIRKSGATKPSSLDTDEISDTEFACVQWLTSIPRTDWVWSQGSGAEGFMALCQLLRGKAALMDRVRFQDKPLSTHPRTCHSSHSATDSNPRHHLHHHRQWRCEGKLTLDQQSFQQTRPAEESSRHLNTIGALACKYLQKTIISFVCWHPAQW